jgi:putative MFS transporter
VGRLDDAYAQVRYFERGAHVDSSESAEAPSAVLDHPERRYTALDLFRGKYARRTIINTLYWVMLWLGTGATGLLYLVLVQEGFSLETTLTFGVVATLASAPGYWISAYLLEKIGRRPTLFLYAAIAAAAYILVVHTSDPAMIVTALLAINFTAIGGVGAVYTYLSEQYPTEIRATATAWINVFSRVAMASGSVLTGLLISLVGAQNAFTIGGIAFAAAGLVLLAFGIETRGKSLEEIQALG